MNFWFYCICENAKLAGILVQSQKDMGYNAFYRSEVGSYVVYTTNHDARND